MYDDELLREYEAPRVLSAPARARRRRLIAALVIIALVLVGVGRWTQQALSSDAGAISGSGFITGSVNIAAGKPNAVLNVSRMAPGDSVFHVIKVVNSGSLQYRYAVVANGTDPDGKRLDTQLQIGAFVVPRLADCGRAGTRSASPLGRIRTVTALSPATQPLFGDVARGQQPGDQVMAVDDVQLLCIEAHLPGSTGNTFVSATMALRLVFSAEQTAGNS